MSICGVRNHLATRFLLQLGLCYGEHYRKECRREKKYVNTEKGAAQLVFGNLSFSC